MNRIKRTFEELKENNKKAHISFLVAGDPDLDTSFELIQALIQGGSDIVEIGIPFSDPLADGPAIQAAASRALKQGVKVDEIFDVIKKCRKVTEVPLLFLMYINTMLIYGKEKFIKRCREEGIDGLIIPDLPYEERDEILPLMKKYNIELIPLVAPTSKDRIEKITSDSDGFIYCVSSMGVTGRASTFHKNVENYIQEVREKTTLPLVIGFGITTVEDVKRFEKLGDGVIVGTAIVKEIERTKGNPDKLKVFVDQLFNNK